jgi:hypothetical protein
VVCLVAGMAAGVDSIDDMGMLPYELVRAEEQHRGHASWSRSSPT